MGSGGYSLPELELEAGCSGYFCEVLELAVPDGVLGDETSYPWDELEVEYPLLPVEVVQGVVVSCLSPVEVPVG